MVWTFSFKKMWRRKTDFLHFPLLASTVHPLCSLSIRKARNTECSSRYPDGAPSACPDIANSECLSISSSFPVWSTRKHHTSCSLARKWAVLTDLVAGAERRKDGWYPYASSCFILVMGGHMFQMVQLWITKLLLAWVPETMLKRDFKITHGGHVAECEKETFLFVIMKILKLVITIA